MYVCVYLGFAHCSNISTHRNPRRNSTTGCKNMLQYLPSKQKPYKSNYSQGHSNTNAECHFCTYGKSSGEYLGIFIWKLPLESKPAWEIVLSLLKLFGFSNLSTLGKNKNLVSDIFLLVFYTDIGGKCGVWGRGWCTVLKLLIVVCYI